MTFLEKFFDNFTHVCDTFWPFSLPHYLLILRSLPLLDCLPWRLGLMNPKGWPHLKILLSQPAECCDDKRSPPHLVCTHDKFQEILIQEDESANILLDVQAGTSSNPFFFFFFLEGYNSNQTLRVNSPHLSKITGLTHHYTLLGFKTLPFPTLNCYTTQSQLSLLAERPALNQIPKSCTSPRPLSRYYKDVTPRTPLTAIKQ